MSNPSHHWTSSQEPHSLRRKEILSKYHAEISPLFGNNPWTLVPVMLATIIQTAAAACMGIYDISWAGVFFLSWIIGSVGAGNLMAAHHEISHYLVFKKLSWNKALWIAANCPLGVPLGSLFKQYHVDHHTEMGSDGVDTGIWTAAEAYWVGNPKTLLQSLKPLAFLVLSTYHGVGLHPIAGHCISEHVMLNGDGQETHSCYDPYLNPLLYNFGYHVEHHDFPNIPWNRLPKLRKIAPEYYNHLVSYDTWTQCMWKFITDPKVGVNGVMTKRVKRTGAGKANDGEKPFTPASNMPLLRGITAASVKVN
ncbi:putative Sphingolipid delta(4)-desaturase DES1-like [Nannochloris sp. 'desiccata']|nr:hypothetical protein KSW81_003211 [Chlorella desiccata (nom. nud.)]KAH7625059.1 putative Sphingolipid delta(4)-desaturase DES1-like [Chlorella desiccata (nom. nud.)]